MALQLYVNGVDKSSNILWPSFKWSQALNNEVDTVTFEQNKFAGRSFSVAMLDEIKLYDTGVLVFGGHVVSVDKNFDGYDLERQTVTVKDYSHKMDALLVNEIYQSVPAINIVCDILNKYVNKNMRVEMATFDANEVWSAGTADTTSSHYKVGTQGLKVTSTGTNVTAARVLYLDLTQNGLGTSDYIDVDVFVDDITKLSSAVIKFGDLGLTNYYSKDITSLLTQSGANHLHILVSDFSTTGSPSLTDIYQLQFDVDATGTDTVNLTFSNMQCIDSAAYTRNAAASATQIVQYLRFNYEQPSKCFQQIADLFQWQWYVDELKDVHLFAIYGESAAYNINDTSGNYVYRSLRVQENVDQLRNSIFVKGSDYLDSSVTEDLRHQIDGNNKVFKMGYKYELSTMTLLLQSVEKAVGTDNVDVMSDNQGAIQTIKGTSDQAVGDAAARTYADQQMVMLKKGRLTKVKLRVKKFGAPVDNFQIQVFADNGTTNQPSATNLSTITALAGATITTSYVEYTFALTEAVVNYLLLNKNAKIHYRATRSGAVDASNYYLIDLGAAAYDGMAYIGSAAPAWTAINYKWYFVSVVTYEALYNGETRILTFATAPGAGNTLTVAAQPYKAVFVQYKDNVSIAAYGEYQSKIADNSINTKEGARQRALQEILAWSAAASEGGFTTYTPGLRVGATINVQSTVRGIDTDFLISRISATTRNGSAFEYQVDLITTKTFGIMAWLQSQILRDDKNIVIDDSEVSDKLEDFTEQITFTDTDVATTLFIGHVWSNDAGTTPDRLVWQGVDTTMYWA